MDQQAGTTSSSLPDKIIGDQIRLKQILVNLTKNALKFAHGQPIHILAGYDTEQHVLHVQVVDEGKGIEESERDKLFTLFETSDRT